VVVSSATKYTKTGKATIAAVKVGECATAFGPANDIGAVTATRLTVSPATAAGCSAFGAGGGGFFRGGGGFGRGGFGGGGGGFPGGGVPAGTSVAS
jgi:hypothetical protein